MTRGESELTHSQKLIWAGQQRFPQAPLYNMALAFTIEGPLDIDRFGQAIERLGEVCETFRTTFHEIDGLPKRRVGEQTATVTLVDLSQAPCPKDAATIWIRNQVKRSFVLSETLTDQALLTLSPESHVWYLNQHHLVTDGVTAALVFDTLQRLYRDDELTAPLPGFDTTIPSSTSDGKAHDYWSTRIQQPAPPSLTLYGRGLEVDSIESERVVVSLGEERTARLLALSRSPEIRGFTEDLSLFQLLATLVFAFLHRQTGDSHLAIATPTHNRLTPISKRTPGVFIEIFPLEIRIDGTPSFLDLLKVLKQETLTYLTHARPGQSRPELATRSQVLLNVVPASFNSFTDLPVSTEWVHSGCGDRQHALRLAVFDFEASGNLSFLFDFNREAFGKQERRWTIDQFFKVVDALLDDPHQPIATIDLLGSEDHQRLRLLSHPEPMPVESTTVIDQFEAHRWDYPDRLALCGPCAFDGSQAAVTYAELDNRANQIANHLADLGLSPGDHVALLLEPSIEWVASMLAVVKTGGAYISLSPADPAARWERVLEETTARHLITRGSLSEKLQSKIERTILDRDDPLIGSAPDVPPPREPYPDPCFYLISTSGSTGQPKVIRGKHDSVANLLNDFEERSPLPEPATTTWWTSSTFDVSIYEVWSALAYGRTLHIVPHEMRPDAQAVCQLLEAQQVHSTYLPAFMLPDLADRLESGRLSLPDLRRLLVGVEPIQEALLSRIKQALPKLTLINGYGPAEATVCATLYDVPGDTNRSGIAPIGRPVRNTSVYLLDAFTQPVVPGAPGELYLGGIGLAEGYWDSPELNRSRFVRNPFPNHPHERLYRTGDLAKLLPSGDLQFVGRMDQQLKIQGHRIEPGEVIAVLEDHPAVKQAAIRAFPKEQPTHMVAYITTSASVSAEDLRRHVEGRLARYLLPRTFVFMDTLPLNTNGKVDLQALAEPDRLLSGAEATNATERTLASIWKDVLGLETVGTDENFFDLGGDSISSLRIVAQAHRAGLHLSPGLLFDHPTISDLVGKASSAPIVELPPARPGPVPLGPIQSWFFSKEFAHPGLFLHALSLTLASPVEVHKLEAKLNASLSKHDAFRLTFAQNEAGTWEQTLQETAPPIRLGIGKELLYDACALDEAPLIRAAIVAPDQLILVAHHLIVDGVSWAILLEELEQAEPNKPTLGFSQWATEIATCDFSNDVAFWKAQETNPHPIPIDNPATPRSANIEASRQTIRIELTDAETNALDQATLHETLLTAVGSAIALWAADESVTMEVEGHGSEAELLDVDLSNTVGWFTSLFPLNFRFSVRDTLAARVQMVRKQLRALPRNGASHGCLNELPPSNAEILFNYLGQADMGRTERSLIKHVSPLKLIRHPENQRQHLLEIDALIYQDKLAVHWHFSDRFHNSETIHQVAADALRILQELGEGSETPAEQKDPFPLAKLNSSSMSKLAQLVSEVDQD